LVRHTSDGTVVLSGNFDATTYDVVRDGLADLVAGPSAEVVVVLHGVTSLDAATVRLLVEARRTAVRANRRLRVVGAAGVVRQMIETCGAWHELTDETVCSAVASPGSVTDLDGRGAVDRRWHPAGPDGYRHVGTEIPDRYGQRQVDAEQLLIDREVRGTRREILADLEHVLRTDPRALAAEDFLTVADEPLISGGVSCQPCKPRVTQDRPL
jgi:anti-anti-sigma factor